MSDDSANRINDLSVKIADLSALKNTITERISDTFDKNNILRAVQHSIDQHEDALRRTCMYAEAEKIAERGGFSERSREFLEIMVLVINGILSKLPPF